MDLTTLFPSGKWENNENEIAIYLDSNDLKLLKSIL